MLIVVIKNKDYMKKFLLLLSFIALCAVGFSQYTEVSGNKKYTGLQWVTQGFTIQTANFSQTGDGDSIIIRSAGDSCKVHATNKVSIDPKLQVNGTTVFKGKATLFKCDSSTRNSLSGVTAGDLIFCTNCKGANDTVGVPQIYTGGSWLKLW